MRKGPSDYKPEDRYALMQVSTIRPIDPEKRTNISKQQRRYWRRVCVYGPAFHIYDFRNEVGSYDLLADYIYSHLGYGLFNVAFRSRYCRNKKYNPNFVCPMPPGHRRHKQGRSCSLNRKLRYNWVIKARVEIRPEFRGELEYTYKFDRRRDKMHHMSKLGWRGNRRE